MKRNGFPFAAFVGLTAAKEALLLALVNPRCGGLLISGEKGTGKSALARSARELITRPWADVPVSVTEDRLFGAIDTEAAVQKGKRTLLPGLIAEADGGILYIDDVNLFRQDLLLTILDTEQSGVYHLERDGISAESVTRFTVLSVMDPEAGTLSPAALDRFGLFASADPLTDPGERRLMLRRVVDYEKAPEAFRCAFAEETAALREKIRKAALLLSKVEVSDAMIQLAAVYTLKAYCAGHRADLYLVEAARAEAALAGRTYVMPKDLEKAAQYVLPHRMRKPPEQEEETPQNQPQEENQEEQLSQPQQNQNPQDGNDPSREMPPPPPDTGETGEEQETPPKEEEPEEKGKSASQDRVDAANLHVRLPPLMIDQGKDRKKRKGSGKRSTTITDTRQGRYVRAEVPRGKSEDIAFDATLRAAAPYQKSRRERAETKQAVFIEKGDIRTKVREKRVGDIFLFCVDASGSMGARERMKLVKGVIFQMLLDAYQKRDKVGMIAFRRKKGEVLLPVTRSVDLAQKRLASMPTGGKTPLAAGLAAAENVLDGLYRQDPTQEPVLILITDGRATKALEKGGDPVQEALDIAKRLGKRNLPIAVIDTESGFVRMGIAKDLAKAMNAGYYAVDKLSAQRLLRIVKGTGKRN